MPSMDDRTRLAGCAVIELALKQIGDPSRTQEHRDELEVILKDVDAQFVALEIATMMVGMAVAHEAGDYVTLGQIVDGVRARVIGSAPSTQPEADDEG
jgi:hypothetical protein